MNYKDIFLQLRKIKTEKNEEKRKVLEVNLLSLELSKEQKEIIKSIFSGNVIDELLQYAKLAYTFSHNGVPAEQAEKLNTLFDSSEQALKYIEQYLKNNKDNKNDFFHDACNFVLPKVDECDFKKWKKLIINNLLDPMVLKILPNIHEIEKLLKSNQGKKRYIKKLSRELKELKKIEQLTDEQEKRLIELNDILSKEKSEAENKQKKQKEIKKEIGQLSKEFKKLAKRKGNLSHAEEDKFEKLNALLSQKRLDAAELFVGTSLDRVDIFILQVFYEKFVRDSSQAYKYFIENGLTKSDFGKFLDLDRSEAGKNLPDLLIDGRDIGYEGFYLKKVNVQDELEAARASCFGKLTDCCQSLSGEAGEPCTIHGLTSPNGGFYVICKGDVNSPSIDDELYSQSWSWLSEDKALVLDSVEMGYKLRRENNIEMVKNFLFYAGIILQEQNEITLYCGRHSGISRRMIIREIEKNKFPIDYNGYRDSKKQGLISSKWFVLSDENKSLNYEFVKNIYEKVKQEFIKIMSEIKSPDDILKNDFLRDNLSFYIKTSIEFPLSIKELLTEEQFKIIDEYIKENIHLRKLYLDNEYDFEKIKEIIEKVSFLDFSIFLVGETYLIYTVQHNRIDIVKLLLDRGVEIDLYDNHGSTALIYAVKKENVDMVKLLLNNNAKIDLQNNMGLTALMYAVEKENIDIVELLLNNKAKIDLHDNHGLTSLMSAVIEENVDIVKLLLNNNAKIDLQNNKGSTALIYAVRKENVDIVKLLLNKGANIKLKDKYGDTAHDLAKVAMNRIIKKVFYNLVNKNKVINVKETLLFSSLENKSINNLINTEELTKDGDSLGKKTP